MNDEWNDNVLDILMYLFENYMDDDASLSENKEVLQNNLRKAGFSLDRIQKALTWLDELGAKKIIAGEPRSHAIASIRLYNQHEISRLDVDSRGFLQFLENLGVLDMGTRELVIERCLALEDDDIGLEQLQWVILVVLFNQPGQEANFAWMEDLIYEDEHSVAH